MTAIHCIRCNQPLDLKPEVSEWVAENFGQTNGTCDNCIDAVQAEDAQNAANAAKTAREAVARDFVPADYRDTDLGRLSADQRDVLSHKFFQGMGIVLHGPSGTRKTRTAYAVISARLLDGTFSSAASVRGSQIARMVQSGFSDDRLERDAAKNAMDELMSAPIILLDDLDKIRPSPASVEFLFDLFEYRASRRLPVIITTQATGDKMAALMADRKDSTVPVAIVRRIREFCKPINTRQTP
jgi:DNA replication protein DnaC